MSNLTHKHEAERLACALKISQPQQHYKNTHINYSAIDHSKRRAGEKMVEGRKEQGPASSLDYIPKTNKVWAPTKLTWQLFAELRCVAGMCVCFVYLTHKTHVPCRTSVKHGED